MGAVAADQAALLQRTSTDDLVLFEKRPEYTRGRKVTLSPLLLSDDLSMQALGGSLGERASRAIAAGCDVALHCNGRMNEMTEIVARTGPMTEAAGRRFDAGRGFLARHRDPAGKAGLADAGRRLEALLPEWG